MAGYYYMLGSESGKERGKEMIISVFIGMLILFGSYVLLRQINPTLVTFRQIQPPQVANPYPDGYPPCKDVGLGENCTLPNGGQGTGNGNGGGDPVGAGGASLTCNVAGKEKQGLGSCSNNGVVTCPDCVKVTGSREAVAFCTGEFCEQ